MPVWEYECRTCNYRFELLQGLTATPPQECPECGEPNPEKIISRSGFQLKGGGWSKDGYAKAEG